MSPFFSIITATRNAASVLPGLLSSLEEQTCRDFELIIQDAASTDSTLDCLKNYQNRLPAVSVASAPDSGIYDAWNRAILQAHGEWLLFLGADDRLPDSTTLNKIHNILSHVPSSVLFASGGVNITDCNDNTLFVSVAPQEPGTECLRNLNIPAPFTGLFVRKSLCLANPFNSNFRIAGDYEFLCRVWQDDAVIVLPFIVAHMLEGGISSDPLCCVRMRWEYICAASRHGMTRPIFMTIRLLKTAIVGLCFSLLGIYRATSFLNSLRQLRGLSPSWRVPTLKAHSQDKS